MSDDRSIELEVEVQGSPEEVWQAIATGPGISSWFVPHTVEEQEGGATIARFGPGPEMEVGGRVAAWDPPHRVVFDGGEGVNDLAYEWLVEARDGGSCVVRLVNFGFGSGDEWDAQYDGMSEGWPMFLRNLQLHLEHFAGQTATPALASGIWAGPRDEAWRTMTEGFGFSGAPAVGQRVEVSGGDSPTLTGTVVDTTPYRISLLIDQPAAGTGFVAVEDAGEHMSASVWLYLYGADGAVAVEHDEIRWSDWLAVRGQ